MVNDLWKGKAAQATHRRSRERRCLFGEMVQMDSSIHAWMEGEPPFWLINIIDDATSRIFCRFYDADSTETNMDCLKSYCENVGVPLSIYVDQAGHFQHNPTKGVRMPGKPKVETQLQRAFKELGIEHIVAHSPQAKGRVERCFSTLQDRLVKGLRVDNAKTREEANEYLLKFIARHNGKFAVPPKSPANVHKPAGGFDLEAIFSHQEERKVTKDNTISYLGRKIQIDYREDEADLSGKKVIVEKRLNGTLAIRKDKTYFRFHMIH